MNNLHTSEYKEANILGSIVKIRPRRRQGPNPLIEGVKKFQDELRKFQEQQQQSLKISQKWPYKGGNVPDIQRLKGLQEQLK